MNLFSCLRTALAIFALMAPALCFSQPQSVDPSGTCTINSTNQMIVGQSGMLVCYPTALGSTSGTWMYVMPGVNSVSYTIAFNNTSLIGTAALTKDITLFTLPANAKVLIAQLTTTTTWAGTATLTASIGDATSVTSFTSTQNLQTAASATTLVLNSAPKVITTAADAVLVHFIATTNNLTLLTAGALRVDITYVLMAPSAVAITASNWSNPPGWALPSRQSQYTS